MLCFAVGVSSKSVKRIKYKLEEIAVITVIIIMHMIWNNGFKLRLLGQVLFLPKSRDLIQLFKNICYITIKAIDIFEQLLALINHVPQQTDLIG